MVDFCPHHRWRDDFTGIAFKQFINNETYHNNPSTVININTPLLKECIDAFKQETINQSSQK